MHRTTALVNVRAFLPRDKEITGILNGCAMQPIDGWRVWRNSGWLISFNDDRKISVKSGLEIDLTDLYARARPQQIIGLARTVLLEIHDSKICLIFLCHDKRFRALEIDESGARPLIPVKFGLPTLRRLIRQKVESPGSNQTYWKWPPNNQFLQQIENKTLCNQMITLLKDCSDT